MNEFMKNILYNSKKIKINRLLMIYLAVGMILYLKEYSSFSYINFIYAGLGHPYVLSFFLLPVCFIKIAYLLFNTDNKNIISRFPSKKNFYIFQIKMIFKELNSIFFLYLFILFVSANLFASRDNFLLPDANYREILNIVGLGFLLIKLYVLLITINILSVCSKNLLDNKIFLVISMIFIISFMDFITIGHLEVILPSYYVGFKHIFSSFSLNILCSLLYFSIINIINYLVLKKITYKRDII